MLYPVFTTTLKTLFAIFIALATYFILKYVIYTKWKLNYYVKQGLKPVFFPVTGINNRGKNSEKAFKDGMAHFKNLAQEDPNVRAEVGNSGSDIAVLLFDPKLIRDFYAKQAYYEKTKPFQTMREIMGTGLVLAEGNLWKNHRKIISSRFHFEFLKDNIPSITATAREFLNDIAKTPMKNINILDEVQKITGEVVGRIFFGENLNKYKFKGQILTLYLTDLMSRSTAGLRRNYLALVAFILGFDLRIVPSYRVLSEEIKEFRQFCFKIIKDRKESGIKGNDLLGVLLETQNSSNAEDRFTDEDIINEFITFFIAGMDTTGNMINMALYLLQANPQSFERLQEEIQTVYNKTESVTIENLNQMDFLNSILKETLRLYTPAPFMFPRKAQADHMLGDIHIKKGTSVRPTPIFNYANPNYFEEPKKFKPERWLKKKEQDIDSYVFLPFSAGSRNCIGQNLAMIEAKIILCEFIKMFKFEMTEKDYDFIIGFNFLYRPKKDICMDLQLK